MNISRLLSKVSLDISCAEQIVLSGHMKSLIRAMCSTHRDHSAVLIRLAYILGNLTTNFDSARAELNHPDAKSLQSIIELSTYYLQRDITPEQFVKSDAADKKSGKSKYEEFTSGNLEDAITKCIKLIANLSTEPEPTFRDL